MGRAPLCSKVKRTTVRREVTDWVDAAFLKLDDGFFRRRITFNICAELSDRLAHLHQLCVDVIVSLVGVVMK